MQSSAEVCRSLWSSPSASSSTAGLPVILFQQLQYISSVDSSSTPSSSSAVTLTNELFDSCLSIYEFLLSSSLSSPPPPPLSSASHSTLSLYSEILLDKRNFNFMKLCILLLSSHEYNTALSQFLIRCLFSEELLAEYLSLGIMDGLFNLFLKFKQNQNLLSDVLRVYIGPLYNIALLDSIATSLLQLMRYHAGGGRGSGPSSTSLLLFHPNHLESIGQLFGVICNELKKGLLRYSAELQELTDHLLLLLNEIIEGVFVANGSPLSDYLKGEYHPLMQRWNEDLASAYQEGLAVIKRSIDMEVAGGSGEDGSQLLVVHPLLRNGVVSSEDLLVTAIPLWSPSSGPAQRYTVPVALDISMEALRNGFSSLYQRDVLLFYDDTSDNNKRRPLVQRRDFDQLVERIMATSQQQHSATARPVPIPVYVNINTAPSTFNTLQRPLTIQTSGLGDPHHKRQTLLELQRTCNLLHKKIDQKLMESFYDYFLSHSSTGTGEINQEQFLAILCSLTHQTYSSDEAQHIFHAFDDDGNGLLTLQEICIGFAKLLSGTVEDKLRIIFDSYDSDRNQRLDLEELITMIMKSTHRGYEEAREIAITAGNAYDANHDNVLDFKEFTEAYYAGLIPLGFTWTSDTSAPNRGGALAANRKHGTGPRQQQTIATAPPFSSKAKPFESLRKPSTPGRGGGASSGGKPKPFTGTLDDLLQRHSGSGGGGQRHREIRRAVSVGAEDDFVGPDEVPVLTRQGAGGGGRGGGKQSSRDDSTLFQHRKSR
jgi:Ca2+-binding EF-hand superfamily protein